MAKNQQQTQETPNINLIGVGTKIVGNIITSGDIRIDGSVSGKIETQGKLVVGSSGIIEGELKVKNADISGAIVGTLYVSESLSLKASSSIEGDIHTARLEIEPGANFCGNCTMNDKKSRNQPILQEEKETKSV